MMTSITVIFLLINVMALLAVPRHIAPLPLLVGCCYMTVGQCFTLGPIHCTVIRVLIATGILRVLLRGERVIGNYTGMDMLMLAWMSWLVLSTLLHPGNESPIVYNLGQAFNIGGIFFLFRVFCGSLTELVCITRLIAVLLAPIAAEMMLEQLTGRNLFSVLGSYVGQRDDKFRAVGPFGHAILAGSVGAGCFPLMVGLWKRFHVQALIGIVACLTMVGASNSSGPIMSLMFALGAMAVWRCRHLTGMLRRGAVVGYLLLEIVMKRPAYYIIADIDLTGSSSSWHRARLIEASIKYIDEWWLAGTNYTRHWVASGVSWSPDHTDITNYYLLMGTWAGLPLMLLFIAMIWLGFCYVGQVVKRQSLSLSFDLFMVWCLGASLFAHTTTCVSVAYFDQSYIFMFLCLAAASSLYSMEKGRSGGMPAMPEGSNESSASSVKLLAYEML